MPLLISNVIVPSYREVEKCGLFFCGLFLGSLVPSVLNGSITEREKEVMEERNNVPICYTCGRNGLLSIGISYGIFFIMTHKKPFC